MYKLYGTRQSGSAATEAVLAEVGEAFEHVEVNTSRGDQFSEEYTRINPRQQVPALELPDGSIITEGIAILMHIADTHPEVGLAPPCGTVERGQLNRWLSFFATNVYEGESRRIRASRYSTDPNGAQYVVDAAKEYI
ncbi:MAG: glutathione S-transferase N-terminal domain-containing protein, partial [Acidiferrobacterales bacterium]